MDKTFPDQKLFPRDKNYILKEAQTLLCKPLLSKMVESSIEAYYYHFNPLRLLDDTTLAIQNKLVPEIENLFSFYWDLAGIYRYKYGENQLEFLFDGGSHLEKYMSDWEDSFSLWVRSFCNNKPFVKAILESAVLTHDNLRMELINQRLKSLLSQFFDLKVYKYKGIQPVGEVA